MIRKFFKDWQAFVSCCGFFVACLSLYYTIDAQKTDRQYREASIFPALEFTMEGADFDYRLTNVGLGPAILKRVRVRKGDQGVDVESVSQTVDLSSYHRSEVAKKI